jgi:phosphoenolpyruvate phosphomutase
MKALLLNSGVGRRMGESTALRPKCMCEIGGGYTILSRQLTLLDRAGVRETVITVGPFAPQLKSYVDSLGLKMKITYVPNPLYDKTNYIYSMHLAKEQLNDDILLLHGDLVLEKSVLNDLLSSLSKRKSAVAVDSTVPLPQKDFKARIADGRVMAIGIEFFGPDCLASQPAYFWKKEDFAAWMQSIGDFCRRGDVKVYAENAFNEKQGAIPLYPMELNGRLCHEIDTPEDLKTVSGMFLRSLQEEEKGGAAL